MCELTTVLAVIGTATTVMGAVQQGKAQSDAYEYQAEMANREANNERDAARDHADKIRKLARRQTGEQTAALAASGVSVAEGTPLVIEQDTLQRGEEDAFTELLNGERRANSLEGQAALYKSGAKNAVTSSYLSAGSSLLSGAGAIASGWKKAPTAPTGGNVPGGYNTRIG